MRISDWSCDVCSSDLVGIGRALITANIVLAEKPQISADVQMANAAYGDYVVRKARGRIDYRGGRGRAQLVADGSTGVPFSLALNAALRPTLYAVALEGRASNIPFRFRSEERRVGKQLVSTCCSMESTDT